MPSMATESVRRNEPTRCAIWATVASERAGAFGSAASVTTWRAGRRCPLGWWATLRSPRSN